MVTLLEAKTCSFHVLIIYNPRLELVSLLLKKLGAFYYASSTTKMPSTARAKHPLDEIEQHWLSKQVMALVHSFYSD